MRGIRIYGTIDRCVGGITPSLVKNVVSVRNENCRFCSIIALAELEDDEAEADCCGGYRSSARWSHISFVSTFASSFFISAFSSITILSTIVLNSTENEKGGNDLMTSSVDCSRCADAACRSPTLSFGCLFSTVAADGFSEDEWAAPFLEPFLPFFFDPADADEEALGLSSSSDGGTPGEGEGEGCDAATSKGKG